MASTIESIAVTIPTRRPRRGARRLADEAIRSAVEQAGLTTGEIELIVNAGVYHDRNMGEPALAALIQEDVGAHPEDPHSGTRGTFSFDVSNGLCGPLTALQVTDGFMRARAIDRAVVVASDASPGRRRATAFPFAPAGAAVVCRWSDRPEGLSAFRWRTFPEYASLFQSRVVFQNGRNVLRIDQAPDFGIRAAACAAEVAADLLDDIGMKPGDIDLIVASPLTPEFLARLPGILGFPDDRIVRVAGGDRIHTAGLFVALAAAERDGRLAHARRVLLTSAGAGLVAGAAILHR